MDLTFPQCANVILHQFFHKWSRKRLGQLHKHYCTGTVKEQWIFGLTEPLDSSKARAEKWEIGTSLQTPFASESQINSVPWLCARNLDPFWFKNLEKGKLCVFGDVERREGIRPQPWMLLVLQFETTFFQISHGFFHQSRDFRSLKLVTILISRL